LRRSWLRIVLVTVALGAIAGIAFAVIRGGSTPDSLAVGDCIDVPTSAEISSIPRRSCTEAHAGEVFHIFEAGGDAAAYPSDPEWAELIYPVCDPAFQAYTGTPVETTTDIDYVYLVPTADRWADGDRRVTCFLRALDGAPLLRSYRESR
jgi:Septum formation